MAIRATTAPKIFDGARTLKTPPTASDMPSALDRILAIPRRADASPELVRELSAFLREPWSTATLRPAQASALRELYARRGLFAPMRVGAGKTLVTLLAPVLLGLEGQSMLVVRGSDRDKTRSDYVAYKRSGWRVSMPALTTYAALGHPKHADDLPQAMPRLLMADEAHKLFNLGGTAAWRVERYVEEHKPIFAALSGTLIEDELMRYWHLLKWALGESAPVPLMRSEAEDWALRLDASVPLFSRRSLGPLERIPGGFHQWLRESVGVVPTSEDCAAPLTIRWWRFELPSRLRELIASVAETGLRPDGEPLDEWGAPDCISQLAGGGFFYVWDPLPPDRWRYPRKRWYAYVRRVLDMRIPEYDSRARIANALDADKPVPGATEGRALLAEWRKVADTYEPSPVPVWIDDTPLRAAADCPDGTIVWTRHRAAGERLAQMGVPWYPGGTNAEDAPHGRTIACQISAQGTGKNLQYGWHRNRVLTPMASARGWEQVIGRTHRPPQRRPVEFEIIDTALYHREVMRRVRASARVISENNGYKQKIIAAEWAD